MWQGCKRSLFPFPLRIQRLEYREVKGTRVHIFWPQNGEEITDLKKSRSRCKKKKTKNNNRTEQIPPSSEEIKSQYPLIRRLAPSSLGRPASASCTGHVGGILPQPADGF